MVPHLAEDLGAAPTLGEGVVASDPVEEFSARAPWITLRRAHASNIATSVADGQLGDLEHGLY